VVDFIGLTDSFADLKTNSDSVQMETEAFIQKYFFFNLVIIFSYF